MITLIDCNQHLPSVSRLLRVDAADPFRATLREDMVMLPDTPGLIPLLAPWLLKPDAWHGTEAEMTA